MIIDGNEVVGRKYAYETKPRLVYIIQWHGDNWDEMIQFLRRFTPGWTMSTYTTYERTIAIKRNSDLLADFVIEPGEFLIKYSWDNDGTTGWDADVIEDYRKKLIL